MRNIKKESPLKKVISKKKAETKKCDYENFDLRKSISDLFFIHCQLDQKIRENYF